MNQYDLVGKTAVVTGAARGIGYAVARRLLESGAAVAIWDMDAEAADHASEELGSHGEVFAVPVDLTDYTQVMAAVDTSSERLGSLDIVVNNAGIAGATVPTWEYELNEWNRVVTTDLYSVFHVCRAVVPGMIQRNYGRIVNVASIAGKEGNPNAVAYSAAKAGVIALTKSLGKELAEYDIAVNCITPAAAKTGIFDQMAQHHIDYMLSKIPRKRFLQVDEVAALVGWLVTQENSFTTAAVFDISGGRATY